MEPRYSHDCAGCVFLGISEEADLYYCDQGDSLKTIIARYSDEGPDYISGIAFAGTNPDLAKAKKIAEERGFLNSER